MGEAELVLDDVRWFLHACSRISITIVAIILTHPIMQPRYRSGYSFKDKGQERILAHKMTHANFQHLLEQADVTHGQAGRLSPEAKSREVRVQWDPERSPRIGMLEYRSIQIGISGKICVK